MKLSAFNILFILLLSTTPIFAAQAGSGQLSVFRPSNGVWYTTEANDAGAFSAIRWGLSTDVLVPADYDGDGIIDPAVWRGDSGTWYIQRSSDSRTVYIKWGMTSDYPTGSLPDVPVAADYDGDGRAEIAIWRPDTGQWFVLGSRFEYDYKNAEVFNWGKLGDVPVQRDYDGDGRTDFAVFRPNGNRWYIFRSASQTWSVQTFGTAGADRLVPADYTGDGKADIAVYRGGTWYIKDSTGGSTEQMQFGFSDGIAVPGDYDSDGKTDLAVYRKGTWYIYDSSTPRLRSVAFGNEGDMPLNSLNAKASMVAVP